MFMKNKKGFLHKRFAMDRKGLIDILIIYSYHFKYTQSCRYHESDWERKLLSETRVVNYFNIGRCD